MNLQRNHSKHVVMSNKIQAYRNRRESNHTLGKLSVKTCYNLERCPYFLTQNTVTSNTTKQRTKNHHHSYEKTKRHLSVNLQR